MSKIWRNIIISSLLAISVYLFIFYSETTVLPELKNQWKGILAATLLVNMVSYSLYLLNRRYNKLFPWGSNISFRIFIEVASGVLLTAIAAAIFIFTYVKFNLPVKEINLLDFVYDGTIKFAILSVVIIYGYSMINFSIYSYNQYSVGQIKALESERIQIDLSFEALKSQLNPHFLFNALNTISSLIYVNVKQAEKYIRLLSKTYDYILETNDTKLVSLQEELEMVKAYFFMHKIRYDDSVELTINSNLDNKDGFIPPFTLQILVENALKHSAITVEEPLIIEIYSNNEQQIIVRNNIVKKPVVQSTMDNLLNREKESESYKIGLANITSRYMFLIQKDIEVISGKHFTVKIPIISIRNEK
jgi:two-component system, LytTR family, sensor kinase